MKVIFLQSVNISGQINIRAGSILPACDDGDYIMVRMPDCRTIQVPKNEMEGIVEICI